MTFHPDFWVAVATTSPVITLAAIVSTRDALAVPGAITTLPDAAAKSRKSLAIVNIAIPVLLGANIAVQIVTLYHALITLSDGNDGHSNLRTIANVEILGFLLVLVNVILIYYGNLVGNPSEDEAPPAEQTDGAPEQTA